MVRRRLRTVRAAAVCLLAADVVVVALGGAGARGAPNAVHTRSAPKSPESAVVGLALAGTMYVWRAQSADPALMSVSGSPRVAPVALSAPRPLSMPPVSVPPVAELIAPMAPVTTIPAPPPSTTQAASASSKSATPKAGAAKAGAAMPLPLQYLRYGSVDNGVDYGAPGGTPLYAMGPGVIVSAGIAGFGANTPVLRITGGPLAGRTIYYGHAGPNLLPVGSHVVAGQQISVVGYGIVGISSGPHLEIGFYPLGGDGTGRAMLDFINGQLRSAG
jgi:Peptidase family M23